MTAALRLAGVVHRFGATLALDGASLEVRPGEVHALLGENGAGKSTLLGILGGLLVPGSGTMEVDGAPYAPRSPRDARLRGIALIHQELSLFPHQTVMDDDIRRLQRAEGAQRQMRGGTRACPHEGDSGGEGCEDGQVGHGRVPLLMGWNIGYFPCFGPAALADKNDCSNTAP